MGVKLDLKINVVAVHLGPSERKCQSLFRKTVDRWENNIKMTPKETE
jgi:hypothetical protein